MLSKKLVVFQILAAVVLSAVSAVAAPLTFNVDGVISDSSNQPLEAALVNFQIDVKDTSETCLLYRENFSVVMTGSNGYFSIVVGKQSNAVSGGMTLEKVLSNAATAITGQSCTYTPTGANDTRKVIITFDDNSGAGAQVFSSQEIQSVPYAVEASQSAKFTGTLSGDVTGTQTATVVSKIQGATVNMAGIADGKVLKYQSGSFIVADDLVGTPGITALTGDVTASGSGSVAATIGVGKVTSAHILDGTIVGADMNFTGTNNSTTTIVLKDSSGKFYDFSCSTAGQVVSWTAAGWACTTPAATGITSLNGLTGATQTLAVAASGTSLAFTSTGTTHTLNIPLATNSGTAAGLLSNTDYTALVANDAAKLPLAGGTMSGAVDMGSQNLVNIGHITMAGNKYLALSSFPSGTGTSAGQMWFDGSNIKYYDGTAAKTLATSTGAFSGALSDGKIWIGNSAGGAQQITLGGDITSVDNSSGSVVVTKTTTGQSNKILSLDASGVANVFGVGLKGFTTGTVTLQAATNSNTYSMTLPAATPAAGQTLQAIDSAGNLQWITPSTGGITTFNGSTASSQSLATGTSGAAPSWTTVTGTGVHTLNIPLAATSGTTAGLVSYNDYVSMMAKQSASLTSGQIWIGNSGNGAVAQTMSGDATIATNGTLTLKSLGTVGTYGKVTTDAQGRVISGAALASTDVATALGFSPVGSSSLTSLFANGGNTFGTTTTLGTNDNNALNFATNSTTRMTISTTGNVGIGTTAPSAALDLSSKTDALALPKGTNAQQPLATTATAGYLRYNTTNAALEYSNGTAWNTLSSGNANAFVNGGNAFNANATIGTTDNYSLSLLTGNTTQLTITTAGNIGIGMINPSVSLDASVKTDAIRLPAGTAAQRPSAAYGLLRYNTATNTLEYHNGTAWTTVGTSLGYTPVNIAGDTMTGDLKTLNLNITAGKYLSLGAGSTAGTVAGQMWFDSGVIKYFDGTSAKSLGIAGAGITNLNGLTSGTQSFAVNTSGTSPQIVSSLSTHTLSIPMASTSTATAGLISNTDYTAFSNKMGTTLSAGQMWVGSASNVAQALTLNGDVSSVSNTGSVVVNKTVTGTANTILSLDGSGIATAKGLSLSSSGAVTLAPATTTANYTLHFPTALPASNGMFLNSDTSGNMSWTTASGALGYTPLNKAGDAMNGNLSMGMNDLTNLFNLSSTGAMNLTAGAGVNSTSSAGSNINITAQSVTGTYNGGNIILSPGTSSSGQRGSVSIGNSTPSNSYLLNVGSGSTGDTSLFSGSSSTPIGYFINYNSGGPAGQFQNQISGAYARFGIGNYAAIFNNSTTPGSGPSYVGIGTSTPTSKLQVVDTYTTDPGGTVIGSNFGVTAYGGSASTTQYTAAQGSVTAAGSANVNTITGVSGIATNPIASVTTFSSYGVQGLSQNSSTGTITNAYGASGVVQNNTTGTIASAYGGFFGVSNLSSGTISNGYGVYIGNVSSSVANNRFSLYSYDSSTLSYIAGKLGVGKVPSAIFDVVSTGVTPAIQSTSYSTYVAGYFVNNGGTGASASLAVNDNALFANGHISSSGTTPTLSSCSGGSIASTSTDTRGTVTAGSATTCTLTFNKVYLQAPTCVVSNTGTTVAAVYAAASTTTTTLTITLSAVASGKTFSYICIE